MRTTKTNVKHGTITAYAGGCSCAKCRKAWAVHNRGRSSARSAALRRLGNLYPEEARRLYIEECKKRGLTYQRRAGED